MAVRPILRYPHQGLSQICQPVETFGENLQALVSDLIDTMRAAPGVGITAAHIGVLQRVFVLELEPGTVEVYINPQVKSLSEEMARHTEGSVSMPGMTDELERPASLTLTYQSIDGNEKSMEASGFRATCILHEIDQLDGIFWIKRLSRIKRDRLIRKWEKHSKA